MSDFAGKLDCSEEKRVNESTWMPLDLSTCQSSLSGGLCAGQGLCGAARQERETVVSEA